MIAWDNQARGDVCRDLNPRLHQVGMEAAALIHDVQLKLVPLATLKNGKQAITKTAKSKLMLTRSKKFTNSEAGFLEGQS